MNQLDPLGYSHYLVLIAHPDDEVNCAALVRRLIMQGKAVRIILLTNGDGGTNAAGRTAEMMQSVQAIGLNTQDLIPLNIPEPELLARAAFAYQEVMHKTTDFTPDCIISLDYEGGHEGHDMASYIAHKLAQNLDIPQIVFPDYHFRNMKRYGMEFLPGRKADYTLLLTEEEKDLKVSLIEAHKGQVGFYMRLQKNQDNYFSLLFEREVYRLMPEAYDFLTRPNYQIGYEYHRNGFKFSDFVVAAKSIEHIKE